MTGICAPRTTGITASDTSAAAEAAANFDVNIILKVECTRVVRGGGDGMVKI